MRRGWVRALRRDESGANLAEFAIVALFLIILLCGVADVGRALYDQMVITNAVREGARFAARRPLESVSAAQQKTLTEIANGDASLTCQTPAVTQESDATGKAKRVSVTCSFTTITPFFTDFDLYAEAVMKVEGPA